MKTPVFCGLTFATLFALTSCGTLKVVKPETNPDKGALMLDWSGGAPKVVETYSCRMKTTAGKEVSAIRKTEDEARRETLARCRDEALITFCNEKNVSCTKN